MSLPEITSISYYIDGRPAEMRLDFADGSSLDVYPESGKHIRYFQKEGQWYWFTMRDTDRISACVNKPGMAMIEIVLQGAQP